VTKSDFIDAVAVRSNLSKKDAGAAVDAVLESVKDALSKGDDVVFTGFGKFTVQNRKARTGVNPRNPGQKVQIPASKVPKFSAGSQLKAAVKS
jgi:DNA-binding protein HU-beta